MPIHIAPEVILAYAEVQSLSEDANTSEMGIRAVAVITQAIRSRYSHFNGYAPDVGNRVLKIHHDFCPDKPLGTEVSPELWTPENIITIANNSSFLMLTADINMLEKFLSSEVVWGKTSNETLDLLALVSIIASEK